MSPFELTICITALANAAAFNADDDELTLYSALLMQLADTFETIAAQRAARQRRGASAEEGAGAAEKKETERGYGDILGRILMGSPKKY